MNSYDDIINLPNWHPKNHTRMPLYNRSAQFAPFAALVGHDEAIRETARLTDHMNLDSLTIEMLNKKYNRLIQRISEKPEIEITYFERDNRKDGGRFCTHKGIVRTIYEADRIIVFDNDINIQISSIYDIKGAIFDDIDNTE